MLYSEKQPLEARQNNAVNFGYAFHEIMARIYVKTDVEEDTHNQGQIRISQLDQLLNLINQLVHHPELESSLTPITSNTMKEPFTPRWFAIATRLLVVLPNNALFWTINR